MSISRLINQYLHSHCIRLQWRIRKPWQIFSNKRHLSRDGKIEIDFFDFLGGFRRFSINIRIEVHFFRLHWEMKGHWSRVNLWEALCASQDLNVTSVLSFPNANWTQSSKRYNSKHCGKFHKRKKSPMKIKEVAIDILTSLIYANQQDSRFQDFKIYWIILVGQINGKKTSYLQNIIQYYKCSQWQ